MEIIQLERLGKTFIMRIANPGEPLQEIGRTDAMKCRMKHWQDYLFAVTMPMYWKKAWPGMYELRKQYLIPIMVTGMVYLASRLEIMNVFDGKRKIIHEDTGRFEAPNWMPDGKKLLFNQGGSIYTIPVEGGTPEKLNTGAAKRNNNDHVISFDGKMVGYQFITVMECPVAVAPFIIYQLQVVNQN